VSASFTRILLISLIIYEFQSDLKVLPLSSFDMIIHGLDWLERNCKCDDNCCFLTTKLYNTYFSIVIFLAISEC
jgi:hypothetical protein